MSLTLVETQAIAELAAFLYPYLPGKPHPFANQSMSFLGVAERFELGRFWTGGSKEPAITALLEQTLDHQREKFCDLVLGVVREGIKYRNKKGEPITRTEVQDLNALIERVGFKIPELWDPVFLDTLPRPKDADSANSGNAGADIPPAEQLDRMREELLSLSRADDPQRRGYDLEAFLNKFFGACGLAPRKPFRVTGEQLDGSFQLEGDTYLVEARWRGLPLSAEALYTFQGKVEGKAAWSRGLLLSMSGFSEPGQEAFAKGRSTKIIAMDGADLYVVLEGTVGLKEAISRKARRAAETGDFFVPLRELL